MNLHPRACGLLAATAMAWLGAARGDDPALPAEFRARAVPLLDAHCARCHGEKKQAGGVDFSKYREESAVFLGRKAWRKAIEQVESDEMPPSGRRPLGDDEKASLLAILRRVADPMSGPDRLDPGPSPLRRLSTREYDRTIRDLLGVEIDVVALVGMPDERDDGNRFGNSAASLDVPPAVMEKFFAAADKVLDRFFGTELSSNVEGEVQERARMARERLFGLKPGTWRKPDAEVSPPEGVAEENAAMEVMAGFLRRAHRRPATAADLGAMKDLYRHAKSKGRTYAGCVRLMMKAALVSPRFLFRVEQDPPPGEPRRVDDHELAARLSYFLWSSMPDAALMDLADRGLLTSAGPCKEPMKLGGIPIGAESRPNDRHSSRERAFDGDPGTHFESPGRVGAWIGLDLRTPRRIARIRFAARDNHQDEMKGGKFQASNSADFASGSVDLAAVASRPASGPNRLEIDDPRGFRYVRFLAPEGHAIHLAELEFWGPSELPPLEHEVRRMLDDPKARALTDEFAASWLQIGKLPVARPSTEFFPDFTPEIREALRDEAATFFDKIREEDRSVLELIDADYTYLNESLANYYKIPGVRGREMRRVSVPRASGRGGLLGMGGILAMTSATSRTSPTLRGKWVLEVLLGTPPPPPPANASMLKVQDEPGKEPTSFREKMAQHAAQEACASCHRRMDPLGYALENFDAAGVWRDDDKGRPLDTSGELPTGEALDGVDGLRRVLAGRKEQFERNLVEEMLTYALGRPLDGRDDRAVEETLRALKAADHRFSAMILGIVRGAPFRYRPAS